MDAPLVWPSLCTWGCLDPEKSVNFTKVTQLFHSRSRNWKGGLLTHSPQLEKVAHWESFPRTSWSPGVKVRSCGFKFSSATKVPHILGKLSLPRKGADVAHWAECESLSDHTRDEGPAIDQLLGIPGLHTEGRARSPEPQRSRAEKRLGIHNGLDWPLSGLPVLFFLSPSFLLLPYFLPSSLSFPLSSLPCLWVSQSLLVFISALVSVFPASLLLACLLAPSAAPFFLSFSASSPSPGPGSARAAHAYPTPQS